MMIILVLQGCQKEPINNDIEGFCSYNNLH